MSARSAILMLAAWLLAACSPPVKHLEPRQGPVVILGDSLAAGVGSESGAGFVGLLEERLGIEIVNAGVPGNTTAQGLERLEKDVLDRDPALVIVELGGNDFLRKVDPQETFANLERIIARCHERGAAVLLLGVQGTLIGGEAQRRYAALAKRTGAACVPNIMEGILTRPSLKSDGIHPNDRGYQRVADRVEPELRWMLERMGRL